MSTLSTINRGLISQGYQPLTNEWWVGMLDTVIAVSERKCRTLGVSRNYWDDVVSLALARMSYVHWDESDANITMTVNHQILYAIRRTYHHANNTVSLDPILDSPDDTTISYNDPTDQWVECLANNEWMQTIPLPEREWIMARINGDSWSTIALRANITRTTLYRRVKSVVLDAIEEQSNVSHRYG